MELVEYTACKTGSGRGSTFKLARECRCTLLKIQSRLLISVVLKNNEDSFQFFKYIKGSYNSSHGGFSRLKLKSVLRTAYFQSSETGIFTTSYVGE